MFAQVAMAVHCPSSRARPVGCSHYRCRGVHVARSTQVTSQSSVSCVDSTTVARSKSSMARRGEDVVVTTGDVKEGTPREELIGP